MNSVVRDQELTSETQFTTQALPFPALILRTLPCICIPPPGIVNLGSELKHWSHEEGPVSLLRSSFSSRNHQLCRLGLPSFLPELPRCRGSSRRTRNQRLL